MAMQANVCQIEIKDEADNTNNKLSKHKASNKPIVNSKQVD